jgi:hypothetical protein
MLHFKITISARQGDGKNLAAHILRNQIQAIFKGDDSFNIKTVQTKVNPKQKKSRIDGEIYDTN